MGTSPPPEILDSYEGLHVLFPGKEDDSHCSKTREIPKLTACDKSR